MQSMTNKVIGINPKFMQYGIFNFYFPLLCLLKVHIALFVGWLSMLVASLCWLALFVGCLSLLVGSLCWLPLFVGCLSLLVGSLCWLPLFVGFLSLEFLSLRWGAVWVPLYGMRCSSQSHDVNKMSLKSRDKVFPSAITLYHTFLPLDSGKKLGINVIYRKNYK